MTDQLITTAEYAARARAPESTIRYWRHIGFGPGGFRVGRRVLYRSCDVDSWLDTLREDQAPAPKPTASPKARAARRTTA